MKKYIRVEKVEGVNEAGQYALKPVIVEIFETDQDITTLFHPDIKWIDVTGQDVREGDVMSSDSSSSK